MRRPAFAALAILLLRADMYPDASNAKQPEAYNNIMGSPACTGNTATDTALVQAALDNVPVGGQRIVLPASGCNISAVTVTKDDTTITGPVTLGAGLAAGGTGVTVSANRFRAENLKATAAVRVYAIKAVPVAAPLTDITCTDSSFTGFFYACATLGNATYRVTRFKAINNINIAPAGQNAGAFMVRFTDDYEYRGNKVTGALNSSVYGSADSTRGFITNNYATNIIDSVGGTEACVQIEHAGANADTVIANNVCDDNDIWITDSPNVAVSNNIARRLRISVTGANAFDIDRITATGGTYGGLWVEHYGSVGTTQRVSGSFSNLVLDPARYVIQGVPMSRSYQLPGVYLGKMTFQNIRNKSDASTYATSITRDAGMNLSFSYVDFGVMPQNITGAGGVLAINSAQVMAGTVNAMGYGVTCDSVNDQTAALQAAIDATANLGLLSTAATTGGTLVLPPGICRVTGALNITKGMRITGAGVLGSSNTGGTAIRTASTTADVFNVTAADPVIFENFRIDTLTVKTAGAGIRIAGPTPTTSNTGSIISHMVVQAMWDGIVMSNALGHRIHDSRILEIGHNALTSVNSPEFPDGPGGGSMVHDSIFRTVGATATCRAGIEYQGSGHYKIHDNVFLGCDYAVLFNLTVGPTGTFQILGNGMEDQHQAQISLQQGVSGKDFNNVIIANNELSNLAANATVLPKGSIHIGTGTALSHPKWLNNVVIIGNVLNHGFVTVAGGAWIQIEDGNAITVANNVLNGGNVAAPVTFFHVGAAATGVHIDPSNVAYRNPGGLYSATMNWAEVNAPLAPLAAASLPTCNAARRSRTYTVTDSNTAVFNAAVAGGGANVVLGFCNGTAWVVH